MSNSEPPDEEPIDEDLVDELVALYDDDDAESHRFGGPWTVLKLDAVAAYLTAYTTALKNQPFQLHYIDAFAGSGRCDIDERDGFGPTFLPGSALRALEIAPPFHRFTFIELGARKFDALQRLKAQFPDRALDVIRGDANAELERICRETDWRRRRAVVFLDPYGMRVDWTTLEAIAATQAIDVWYLFPLNSAVRQAAIDPRAVDEKKAARLTRTLGTDRWRTEWYQPKAQQGLFDEGVAEERHLDGGRITEWMTARLRTLFPGLEGPKILRNSRNAPLFALYFLVSNPAARNLACRMAGHILRTL